MNETARCRLAGHPLPRGIRSEWIKSLIKSSLAASQRMHIYMETEGTRERVCDADATNCSHAANLKRSPESRRDKCVRLLRLRWNAFDWNSRMLVSPVNFSHRQRSYLQISWEFFAGPKHALLVTGLKVELGETWLWNILDFGN